MKMGQGIFFGGDEIQNGKVSHGSQWNCWHNKDGHAIRQVRG
jgi:hypothetical protein